MANLPVKFGVVILAAGASSRMGRPKVLLPWKKTTVIGQIISQWNDMGAAQIAVVMRKDDVKLAEEMRRSAEHCSARTTPETRGAMLRAPLNCIPNPQPERGMFSSIVCAANWNGWKKEISHWAIVLGDQPHLQTETLRKLLECVAQNPSAICQPSLNGAEKHPVILPRAVFEELKMTDAETLKTFLKLASAPRVLCPVDDAGLSFDLDTPEDYKRLVPT